jgi:hypothetical protein
MSINPCKTYRRLTPPLGAKQHQSGQDSGARLQRCGGFVSAGCTAPAGALLKENENVRSMAITGIFGLLAVFRLTSGDSFLFPRQQLRQT